MNIHELAEKIKSLGPITEGNTEIIRFDERGEVERHSILDKVYLTLIIILVGSLSFGLGRLSAAKPRSAVRIEYDPSLSALASTPSSQAASVVNAVEDVSNKSLTVVASKNGSKYHYLHCSGAKQISEKNKITFSSASEAEASGYILASNCIPK